MSNTKNRLTDLNDHLFAQIERLADEDLSGDLLEQEVRRGVAIVAVADQVLRLATLQVQAAKVISDHGGSDPVPHLPNFNARSSAPAVIEGRKQ